MKRDLAYFVVFCAVLATMDGLAFYWPHNEGFFSLTYGDDKLTLLGFNVDAWHTLKRLLILEVFTWIAGVHVRKAYWWFQLAIISFLALIVQVTIYDGLIKLF